jgi:hypothetical protein
MAPIVAVANGAEWVVHRPELVFPSRAVRIVVEN